MMDPYNHNNIRNDSLTDMLESVSESQSQSKNINEFKPNNRNKSQI